MIDSEQIRVITGGNKWFDDLTDFTADILYRYARHRRYNFERITFPEDNPMKQYPEGNNMPYQWLKLYYIRKILAESLDDTYVMWFDSDSVIRDFNFKIEDKIEALKEYDIITAEDNNGICTSHMIVHNTQWSREL